MKMAVLIGFPRDGRGPEVIGKPDILPAVKDHFRAAKLTPSTGLTYERVELWTNGKNLVAKLRNTPAPAPEPRVEEPKLKKSKADK